MTSGWVSRKELKMTKKVELCFVLDETGSMGSIRTDTIGSFNTFLEEQKALKADVTFSLTLFSLTSTEDTYRKPYSSVRLVDIKPLTEETYRPRGTTPLLDAVGGTIDGLGVRLADMSELERPDQVVMVILTDGLENASKEYTLEQVKEKITHQRDVYKWEFVFLGSGIDAFDAAGNLGISAQFTAAVSHDTIGTRAAYRYASATVSALVDDDAAAAYNTSE